jgi:Methyl-accepting chemotaxis protein
LTIGYSNALSTDVYRLFTPVQFDGVKTPWSAFVQAPVNEVLKETKTTTLMVVVVSLAVIVLLTVIIVVVTRQIVGPIQQVVAQMEHISRGDLSNEMLKVKTKDETGKLANSLNQMQASLRKLIGNVANASTTIASNQ